MFCLVSCFISANEFMTLKNGALIKDGISGILRFAEEEQYRERVKEQETAWNAVACDEI